MSILTRTRRQPPLADIPQEVLSQEEALPEINAADIAPNGISKIRCLGRFTLNTAKLAVVCSLATAGISAAAYPAVQWLASQSEQLDLSGLDIPGLTRYTAHEKDLIEQIESGGSEALIGVRIEFHMINDDGQRLLMAIKDPIRLNDGRIVYCEERRDELDTDYGIKQLSPHRWVDVKADEGASLAAGPFIVDRPRSVCHGEAGPVGGLRILGLFLREGPLAVSGASQ